jgi:hypothetical protein
VQYPDFVWEIMLCPELQRLREVRLCNINSLCLPGGANINRYEHALGTTYLAIQCLESWLSLIDTKTWRRIILAALLHDIGSAAFGHSVQYVLESKGFEHESLYSKIGLDQNPQQGRFIYQDAYLQPIYFGMPRRLKTMLSTEDLSVINELVAGNGYYGPLVSGTVDLDNIDNVFRLAYHIGLTYSRETPLLLARSIWIQNGRLTISGDSISLLEEWYKVRTTLYRYLLLNPDEFSAKCMLEEALEVAQLQGAITFYWFEVDYQLLEKLMNHPKSSGIVSRLMLGDLYGCLGIYEIPWNDNASKLTNPKHRHALENSIQGQIRKLSSSILKNSDIAIHVIKDVNKTQRQIRVMTSSDEEVVIGNPSSRLLLGVFFKNVHLSMTEIDQEFVNRMELRSVVRSILIRDLQDPNIEELVPYSESDN